MVNYNQQETNTDGKTANDEEEFRLQVELFIETDRILKVLHSTILKLELVMCLPFLLRDNGVILKKFLPNDEHATVVTAFSPYSSSIENTYLLAPESVQTVLTMDLDTIREIVVSQEVVEQQETSHHETFLIRREIKEGKSPATAGRQDPEVSRAMQFLCSKPRLRMFLEQFLLNQISEAGVILIEYIRQLRDCIAERLVVSPSQELANEQKLRLLWSQNIKAMRDVAILQNQREDQRNRGNTLLAERAVEIKKNEELIKDMRRVCKDDILKRKNESERNMISDSRDSEFNQEILQSQLQEAKVKFEKTLSEHLRNEKALKAKKIKVESQLLTVLGKYDADIGDLQIEFEEIMDGFNAEKEQMRELQEKFDIQEVEYVRLMTEKAEEEAMERARKINYFITNRAARILQRAWRKYWRKKRRRRGRRRK